MVWVVRLHCLLLGLVTAVERVVQVHAGVVLAPVAAFPGHGVLPHHFIHQFHDGFLDSRIGGSSLLDGMGGSGQVPGKKTSFVWVGFGPCLSDRLLFTVASGLVCPGIRRACPVVREETTHGKGDPGRDGCGACHRRRQGALSSHHLGSTQGLYEI